MAKISEPMPDENTLQAPAPLAVLAASQAPTPDNTPIPGGGSWHWDASLPGWAPNTPPVTQPHPTQE